MDFSVFQQIWEDFLAFLDRAFQWLMYLFNTDDEEDKEWPPTTYPDINA